MAWNKYCHHEEKKLQKDKENQGANENLSIFRKQISSLPVKIVYSVLVITHGLQKVLSLTKYHTKMTS